MKQQDDGKVPMKIQKYCLVVVVNSEVFKPGMAGILQRGI
jgi:hypothetical protein